MAPDDPMAHRCTAKSKQSGERCKQPAIHGGTVCRFHGGAAPQVQQAAKERLAALVDPAIGRLAELIAQKEFPSTAYAAVKDVLDRNGFKPEEKVAVSGSLARPDEDYSAMLARVKELVAKADA